MSGLQVKPIRFPLAVPFVTREGAKASGGTFATDSYLVNAYIESTKDGRRYVVKRPALTTTATYTGAGQGTSFYNGLLYGVANNTLIRHTTTVLNGAADGSAWALNAPQAGTGRAFFQSCILNGQVFVMGGAAPGGITYNDVYSSRDIINWMQLTGAAPWSPRSEFGLCVLGNTLFLMGGLDAAGTVLNDVWSSKDGINWDMVTGNAPWAGRFGFGCVTFNQGIMVIGGLTAGAVYNNEVWFSADGATWSRITSAAAFSARYRFTTFVYKGKVWIMGGIDAGSIIASIWSTPDGLNWTNTGSLPAAVYGAAGCVYANKMWLLGGRIIGTLVRQTTVWNTTDGVTITVAAANYGGGGIASAQLIAYVTPNSVSTINAATLYLMGGDLATGYTNQSYRATLNIALPTTFAIATAGAVTDQFRFTTQNIGQYLILKNTSDAWVYEAGVLTKITDPNYPQATVPGLVNLDDTVYVMDRFGTIFGSYLSYPYMWSALNFITADYEADAGVGIYKYSNYCLALKATTMQLFRDAGRYPGSPLLPEISANSRIGCMSAATVAVMNNTVVWVARSNELGPHVVAMQGMTAVKISDAAVDKLLSAWIPNTVTTDNATGMRINGHDFYILTLGSYTLYYDFTEKLWGLWGSGTSGIFVGTNYVSDGLVDYLQDITTGKLYTVSPLTFQDNATAITVVIQDLKLDFGTNDKKRCGGITIIGDRRCSSAPNNILLQWSDDDAQTFNTGYTLDLSIARPRLGRQGSFRRRTYKLTHASNNPMRLEALELEVLGK